MTNENAVYVNIAVKYEEVRKATDIKFVLLQTL